MRRLYELLSTSSATHRKERRLATLDELQPDMLFARPVETRQGLHVAARGLRVSAEVIERLKIFYETIGLGPIYVWE